MAKSRKPVLVPMPARIRKMTKELEALNKKVSEIHGHLENEYGFVHRLAQYIFDETGNPCQIPYASKDLCHKLGIPADGDCWILLGLVDDLLKKVNEKKKLP